MSDQVNFYYTVSYRKCNNCKFSGPDTAFKTNTKITQQTSNWVCMTSSKHCPECNSENLSDHFHDNELTQPIVPLKTIQIDNS
jgi:hypothetical protein